ncbi:MAG: hypothetical protein WA667_02195 [Candidatus Nitrosopolaris sp.]
MISSFARLKLLEMKELANRQFGMNIIYGDTDSIFVSAINEKHNQKFIDLFIATCKQIIKILLLEAY